VGVGPRSRVQQHHRLRHVLLRRSRVRALVSVCTRSDDTAPRGISALPFGGEVHHHGLR
jgi:hypothetical protein